MIRYGLEEPMSQPIDVRAVLYEDGGVWVAQCIEYDIAAFAETLSALPRAFERAVAANLSANADIGRKGLEGIPPAPKRFAALYEGSFLDVKPRSGEKGSTLHVDLRVSEAA